MPRAAHGATQRATRAPTSLPAVDDRLVAPGSGAEILEGRLLMSPPGADPPHAMRHLTLAYLLGAHVAPGYAAAIDMLTRADRTSDFAPDASVFPLGADPEMGGRRLEVLAFEIVSRQRLSVAKRKAAKLVARGVDRVFAVALAKNRVVEWDRRTDEWRPVHLDERISHACLAAPLPIRAMLETARADEAVLAALEARRPDLFAGIERRGEARGRAAGKRDAIAMLCRVLSIPIDAARAEHLGAASSAELDEIARALETERRWPDRPRPTRGSRSRD